MGQLKQNSASPAAQYFAEVLRTLRVKAGLSQNELGDQMTYSGAAELQRQHGRRLEAAFSWRKSSYSDSGGGDCLEVATTDSIHVRDSKARELPYLTVSPAAWTRFLTFASSSDRHSGHS